MKSVPAAGTRATEPAQEADKCGVQGLPPSGSATQTEAPDEAAIALDVGLLYVVEEPASLADKQQQSAAAVVVVLVVLEVTGQVSDSLGEQRHLHLWGAGVTVAGAVFVDDLLLRCSVKWHAIPFGACCAAHRGLSTRALSIRGRSYGTFSGYQRTSPPTQSRLQLSALARYAGHDGSGHLHNGPSRPLSLLEELERVVLPLPFPFHDLLVELGQAKDKLLVSAQGASWISGGRSWPFRSVSPPSEQPQ